MRVFYTHVNGSLWAHSHTIIIWDSLPKSVFPPSYDLNLLKREEYQDTYDLNLASLFSLLFYFILEAGNTSELFFIIFVIALERIFNSIKKINNVDMKYGAC